MGPGALRSGRTLAPAPGLPPGSGRNRGAGGRGGVGGRDPRELRRGGEPGSEGEGEGGGAEETLLQHGVSSPRGGCKHGTQAPFQGSPLKGQRLRRDLDSAVAFITSGAGAALRAGRRAGPGSCRAPGGVTSLPAATQPAGPSLCGCVARPARCPPVLAAPSPGPGHTTAAGSAHRRLDSTSALPEERELAASLFPHLKEMPPPPRSVLRLSLFPEPSPRGRGGGWCLAAPENSGVPAAFCGCSARR